MIFKLLFPRKHKELKDLEQKADGLEKTLFSYREIIREGGAPLTELQIMCKVMHDIEKMIWR